jgi:hypothetical protein
MSRWDKDRRVAMLGMTVGAVWVRRERFEAVPLPSPF